MRWACLCVDLCVCTHISKHVSELWHIFCAYSLWPWLDSALMTLHYRTLCTSGCVNDVMDHMARVGGVLQRIRWFRQGRRGGSLILSLCTMASTCAPGAKSAVYCWSFALLLKVFSDRLLNFVNQQNAFTGIKPLSMWIFFPSHFNIFIFGMKVHDYILLLKCLAA